MNKFSVLLLPFLLSASLPAQSLDKALPRRFISFGISPLSAADPVTPTFEAVLEIKPTDRFSLEIKHGFPFYAYHNWSNDRLIDAKYSENRIAVNYFSDSATGRKAGIEYFSLNHNYGKTDDIFTRNSRDIQYETAKISRRVRGLRFLTGYARRISKNITFSLRGTLGVLREDIRYTDLTERQPRGGNVTGWFAGSGNLDIEPVELLKDREEGSKIKPDLTFGVKFAYLFFVKK